MLAMMNMDAVGLYNVGAGENYSMNEVAKLVAEVSGNPDHPIEYIPDRPAEAMVTLSDTTKIRSEFGWKPEIDFKKGLVITYEFQTDASPIITL